MLECAMKITQSFLKTILHYDPLSGVFTWIGRSSPRSRAIIGSEVGCKNTQGYLQVKICGKQYLLSRLAFVYMTGEFPPYLVGHRDRVPLNNRWSNLRAATRSENNRNIGTAANKTSKFRGVSKRGDRWQVVVRIAGRLKYLGCYVNEEEAGAVAAPYFADIAP